MLLFQGFEICVTAFTVIYPGLLSIRAIESKQKDDDKVWLTYWMVVGLLHVAETFFGFVFWIIPYWSWIRVALFVWLIQFNGAQTLYQTVIREFLHKNKDLIQNFIKQTQDMAGAAATKVAKEASDTSNLMKAAQVAGHVQEAVNTATGEADKKEE